MKDYNPKNVKLVINGMEIEGFIENTPIVASEETNKRPDVLGGDITQIVLSLSLDPDLFQRFKTELLIELNKKGEE